MCYARTAVFYGLSVKARTLVVAAKAHQRLLGPLLALDMIGRRAGFATVMTTTGSGAQRVPLEIWNLVRRELYRIELRMASNLWMRAMKCGGAYCKLWAMYADVGPPYSDPHDVSFDWSSGWLTGCEGCVETFEYIVSGDMGAGVRLRHQNPVLSVLPHVFH
ncbi:hypothetical protein P7C70_g2028, partial [Phenoliferia sp. Uapishka_3]